MIKKAMQKTKNDLTFCKKYILTLKTCRYL